MGLYVEVADKKAWWVENVLGCASRKPIATDFDRDFLPCAYMDNGAFQAIAVLWNAKEFARVMGGRPDARLGLVAKTILRSVVPGGERMKELR